MSRRTFAEALFLSIYTVSYFFVVVVVPPNRQIFSSLLLLVVSLLVSRGMLMFPRLIYTINTTAVTARDMYTVLKITAVPAAPLFFEAAPICCTNYVLARNGWCHREELYLYLVCFSQVPQYI